MTKTQIDGGEAVARSLAAAGVDTVFTLHGGHLDAIYYACPASGIRLIDTRHECSAGHAAEAWARLTGKVGVSLVTAGPGFTNILTSMANALVDGTPTLYLVGAPPLREAGLNILQGGIDQLAMARPVAKMVMQITDPERIADRIAAGITVACSGRPGPVLIELPIDVLARSCPALAELPKPVSQGASAPSAVDVDRARVLLESAERPVLVLGGLTRYQASREQIAAFLAETGIPVVSSTRALGLVDPASPNYAHTLDSLAVATASGVGGADVALLLGARNGLFMGGRSEAYLPSTCRRIHVHADAFEFAAVQTPEIASGADCGAFLEALTKVWCKPASEVKSWRNALAGMPAAIDDMFEPATPSGKPHPYFAAKAVVEHSPKDAVFVLEGGENAFWAGYHVRSAVPGGVQVFGQLGALGTGMGMALGAASVGRQVVQITGDGALGFHLQEFDSYARHGLPVVTVILNNSVWGMSLHGQQILYGDDYNCISRLPDTAYEKVAEALGCYAERVDRIEDIAAAMARAFASGKPACINVTTAPEVMLPATQAMLGEVVEGEIMVPYYENIPGA